VSETGHIAHVKKQLPKLGNEAFISEPARRGTASCIVIALSVIAKKHDGDEPIAILFADHYIRDIDGFVRTFKIATETAKQEEKILLIGAEPTYPATGFGYIQKGDILDAKRFVFKVRSFKEKPDYKTALQYLTSGNYLWNCGYFLASLNVFTREMKAYSPQLTKNFEQLVSASQKDIDKIYLEFTNEAIDYALIEHVKDLLVVPASFDWMDLGSFNDLHSAVQNDAGGNHVHGEKVAISDVENAYIYNSEDKPVAVIGLDNIVVVNTEQGILVARKDLSQKVGEMSKHFSSDKS